MRCWLTAATILAIGTFVFGGQAQGAARTLEFSGLTWEVRTGAGGPGNRCWDDGPDSVWVDREDRLHLKVRQTATGWCQAQVAATVPAAFGLHEFRVDARLDRLDPQVVLGMFVYRDDGQEIDIEITEAFDTTSNIGWYVVQPYDGDVPCSAGASACSFDMTLFGTFTTHTLNWSAERVDFQSWHGHCSGPPCGGVIASWGYSGDNVPAESAGLRTHINLWIAGNGEARTEQEIVVSRYSGPLIDGGCSETETGEVGGVRFADRETLVWDGPAKPAGVVTYDVLRSGEARDFGAATCAAFGLEVRSWHTGETPILRETLYYLVRANTACPDGAGSLGQSSDGTPRSSPECP